MRFIPTNIHGALDYIVGILLIVLPWLLDFAGGNAATWVLVIVGAGAIVYSLITDYELSIAKVLSMRAHLTLDICSGIFLIVSPWLFGFAELVYWPHVIVGLIEVGAGLMTRTVPEKRRQPARSRR